MCRNKRMNSLSADKGGRFLYLSWTYTWFILLHLAAFCLSALTPTHVISNSHSSDTGKQHHPPGITALFAQRNTLARVEAGEGAGGVTRRRVRQDFLFTESVYCFPRLCSTVGFCLLCLGSAGAPGIITALWFSVQDFKWAELCHAVRKRSPRLSPQFTAKLREYAKAPRK